MRTLQALRKHAFGALLAAATMLVTAPRTEADPGGTSDALRKAWLGRLLWQADSTSAGTAGGTVTQAPAPAAKPAADPGPFAAGHTRFGLMVGWGQSGNDDYLLLGLGVGYYLVNGVDIGVDGEAWLGSEPGIYKISPGIRYVAYQVPRFKPYVGVHYRHVFVTDDFEDRDALGGRAGVYYASQAGTYIGAGVVYDRYMDCDIGDCDDLYPEISVSIFR